jgi:hypothetical protein
VEITMYVYIQYWNHPRIHHGNYQVSCSIRRKWELNLNYFASSHSNLSMWIW